MSELPLLLAAYFSDLSAHSDGELPRPRRARNAANTVPDAVADTHALPPDETLVAQIKKGDEWAVEQVFHEYAVPLTKFLNSYVQDQDVAEELLQDLFLWILRNRETWQVTGTLRGYLFGAARHYALDYLKHRAVERRWSTTAAAVTDRQSPLVPAADAQLVAEERVARLRHAIEQLAESRRTALTLRWIEGLSYAEIAQVLGSSSKAVENQLNRTLNQLRSLLDAEEL